MSSEGHRLQHLPWHAALEALCADWVLQHPGKLLTETPIGMLLTWSYRQTVVPTEPKSEAIVDAGSKA